MNVFNDAAITENFSAHFRIKLQIISITCFCSRYENVINFNRLKVSEEKVLFKERSEADL